MLTIHSISSLSITVWAIFIYRRSRPNRTTINRYVQSAPVMTTRDSDPFNDEYALPPPPYTATAVRYSG